VLRLALVSVPVLFAGDIYMVNTRVEGSRLESGHQYKNKMRNDANI
jgi:hypothetical protein